MPETASKNSTHAAVRCEVLPTQGDSLTGRVSALAFHRTSATSEDGKEAAQLNAPTPTTPRSSASAVVRTTRFNSSLEHGGCLGG